MKCNIILACLVCILSVELSYSKSNDDKAFSEVMAQIQENMKNLKSIVALSNPSDCTEKFMASIKDLKSTFEKPADVCLEKATANINEYTQSNANYFQEERSEIELRVTSIQNYIQGCTSQNEIDYFNCMAQMTDPSIEYLNKINNNSETVISYNANQLAVIDDEERTCLLGAVNLYEPESEKMVSAMESCLGEH